MGHTHRVAIIGCGRVGATTAFALLHTGQVEELVLIDTDRARAEGEAMDLAHATALLAPARVWAGDYADAASAAIVIVAAGRASASRDESRLQLVGDNVRITRQIVGELAAVGFSGCLLMATNPVDVLAQIAASASPLPAARVIGSGTLLDTARLRQLLAIACALDPRSVHAHILGEHGDSEIVAWSSAAIAGMPWAAFGAQAGVELAPEAILDSVRGAAPAIIERKGATNFAIGAALARLVSCILRDEHSVLMVSTRLAGEYGERDVYLSVPCVVGGGGVERIIEIDLSPAEWAGLHRSAEILRDVARRVAA